MFELVALLIDRSEQRGNSEMWFAHVEADCAVLAADGFDAGQRSPRIGFLAARVAARLAIYPAIDSKLDHVMAAEAIDELGGSAFGDDLAVIDDGEAVAEAFGFVHVVSGEQDGATFFLEDTDYFPELAAALRIESGSRLVEKKDARVADQSGGDGEALLLAAGKLADPGVGFFSEFEFFENFIGGARLAIKAGEEFDGFADV